MFELFRGGLLDILRGLNDLQVKDRQSEKAIQLLLVGEEGCVVGRL
jgi:hypothetical protein